MSKAVSAVILDPLTMSASHIKSGTSVPAVDVAMGEVAWAAGTHVKGAINVNREGSSTG
ncbi:hypothetical protein [Comamonas sp.]|uniref:hypothetical protein n=1 Tax=Comamonas sp. TaxID=34028 RepID=UPI003A94A16B